MHFKINRFIIAALITGIFLASCKKDPGTKAPLLANQNDAYVRVFQYSPNYRTITGGADSFNVYIGTAKINSPFLTYNSAFPVATSPNYVAIPAGNQLFRFSTNGVITADSVTSHSFIKPLSKGQYYSLFITDSIKSTNEKVQMWVLDNFVTPVPGQYGIRLVNAVVTDTTGKNVDLYSVKMKANIFSNVPKGSATSFQCFHVPNGNDTLILRRPGITTWELGRINGITQSSQRVYTIVYKGTTTITTGTKARTIISYINY
jgi:hypothetical protein